MRRILVTGANKGIGLAIARGIVTEHADTVVLLGSRDPERGRAAHRALAAENGAFEARISVVDVDVADDASVARAAGALRASIGDEPLYAVVNNAGIGSGPMRDVLEVNTVGLRRVCEALVPLLDPGRGRIVNVTSASGPVFVAKCSPERQRLFVDAATPWSALEAVMSECLAIDASGGSFRDAGFGEGNAYGLSKACANTYTMNLAGRHPTLRINACTPGFIETDLTRQYAESQGKSPAELGMKSPDEGARCPLVLLFGELEGNGRYYGSDCQRSPLDRYRSAGDPPYTGD